MCNMEFNSEGAGVFNGQYFGLESSLDEATLVLQSVPWDATVSYRQGTSGAPEAIMEASVQVELFDVQYGEQWQRGIFTLDIDPEIAQRNRVARECALTVIEHLESGGSECDDIIKAQIERVNEASEWMNQRVFEGAVRQIEAGHYVGLVGGDHSTPLGLIRALGTKHSSFGILHIEAHMDLRDGYEGFKYSHASIMRRALECTAVEKLVQVGVRDFCGSEREFGLQDSRVAQFLDVELVENRAEGVTWKEQCQKIVESLPERVYISFDIDGLQREFCPSTGTPVPGGLSYNEAVYLLNTVASSGRKVIGFDLNEVAPSEHDEWDAIVGARLLYKLSNILLYTNPIN